MGVWRYTARTFGRELALIVAAILFFIPIYFLVTLSLKSQGDIFADPNSFPTDPVLSNYTTAWQGPASISIARSLVNSLVISVGSVAGLILIGSLCAYTLARRPSKMSTLAYMGFLLGIIIPFQLGVVPIYVRGGGAGRRRRLDEDLPAHRLPAPASRDRDGRGAHGDDHVERVLPAAGLPEREQLPTVAGHDLLVRR
jgi:hypothetical protein